MAISYAGEIAVRVEGKWLVGYLVPEGGSPVELARVHRKWVDLAAERRERFVHFVNEVGVDIAGDCTDGPVYFRPKG